MKKLLISALLLTPSAALAEEGMWLLNEFPKDKVEKAYKFKPDDKWLEHVRLSSVRLAGGCSGSFVSEDGLVMTNHHCVRGCISQLSTKERNYGEFGFYAKTRADEVKCPEIEINQLAEITDVTERIGRATAGLADQKFNEAQKAEMSKIEKECATSDKVRCDVVTLYNGGAYHLYKYRRFQDARLVFAPEQQAAHFGGDPDNFNFPRFCMDAAFLRVYEDDKPPKLTHFFKWSAGGAKENELTFVTGHPGRTSRALTVAELEYLRDTAIPERLFMLSELRGQLTEFSRRGPEEKRIATERLLAYENSYKALRGRHQALAEKDLLAAKDEAQNRLAQKLAASAELKGKYGEAIPTLARLQAEQKKVRWRLYFMEYGVSAMSDLVGHGRTLVRAADERPKDNAVRFRELRDSALPSVTQKLFSAAPIHDPIEVLAATFWLTKLREELGADDPFVKKVLGKSSPEEMAQALISGTKLKDLAVRKALWDGGKAAVDASDDPIIRFVKSIDEDARALRKRYEDELEAPLKKNSELLAKARFEVEGRNTYPDATFTLRATYGKVAGWEENGKQVTPFTTFAGAFDRDTGKPPFDLPESYAKAKARMTLTTPYNFATTNDIIGGNSGSPVINKNAEIVGLIFDGNIHSLGGDYSFDEKKNRAVAVHSEGLIHALAKVYGAERIVQELRPKAGAGAKKAP